MMLYIFVVFIIGYILLDIKHLSIMLFALYFDAKTTKVNNQSDNTIKRKEQS